MMLTRTLRKFSSLWCYKLPPNCVHSFKQFSDLKESIFHHFDPKSLDKKMSKQQKAPHESLMEFWARFRLLPFEALKSQMKFKYLMERYEYVCHKSLHLIVNKNLKRHST